MYESQVVVLLYGVQKYLVLNTTVGYFLGEAKETQLLKDPVMMKRFNEIEELTDKDKECVYSLLDAFIAKSKMQAILK